MKNESRVALLEFGHGWTMWVTAAQLPLTIGRGVENTIILADSLGVSRRHCMVDLRESILHVIDVGSTNGTEVGGRLLRGRSTGLQGRTRIAVGDMAFWMTPCDSSGKLFVASSGEETIYAASGGPSSNPE